MSINHFHLDINLLRTPQNRRLRENSYQQLIRVYELSNQADHIEST